MSHSPVTVRGLGMEQQRANQSQEIYSPEHFHPLLGIVGHMRLEATVRCRDIATRKREPRAVCMWG